MGVLNRIFGRKLQSNNKEKQKTPESSKELSIVEQHPYKTLNEEISSFVQTLSANEDMKDVLQIIEETTRDLIDSQVAKKAIQVGETFPTFKLLNATNELVKSSDILTKTDYTVIIFYRGAWCPFCNMELSSYNRKLDMFKEENVQIVAISPTLPDVTSTFVQDKNLNFTVLSDVGNVVAKKVGIKFKMAKVLHKVYNDMGIDIPKKNGDDSYELPLTSKFVINNKNGEIIYRHIEVDYTKRPEPEEILESIMRRKALESMK